MSMVSFDNLLSVQNQYSNNRSAAADSSSVGQTFANLLAGQLNGSSVGSLETDTTDTQTTSNTAATYAADALTSALTDTTGESDSSNNLMMMFLLMMCSNSSGQGSGMNAAMMSLMDNMNSGGLSGLMSTQNVASSLGLNGLVNDPATATKGQAIVDQAVTRMGDPYSKTKRGTGDYVDCSYLTQWAYKQEGVDIPGTAAAQAKYCYENGYEISKDELQPGDLVFWTKHSSDTGRWREIRHVAIYAGDNKIVEAKTSTGGVVVDDMWGENGSDWDVVMYARPY